MARFYGQHGVKSLFPLRSMSGLPRSTPRDRSQTLLDIEYITSVTECNKLFQNYDKTLGFHGFRRYILTDIPRIPGPLELIFRFIRAARYEFDRSHRRLQPNRRVARLAKLPTGCFASIKAHLSRRRLSRLTPSSRHAAAQVAPATGRSARGFPGTSVAAPQTRPSEKVV
jgi:hypothetical protein